MQIGRCVLGDFCGFVEAPSGVMCPHGFQQHLQGKHAFAGGLLGDSVGFVRLLRLGTRLATGSRPWSTAVRSWSAVGHFADFLLIYNIGISK
jgi:hypothetical protein